MAASSSRNGANVLDLKCSHFVEPQGDQRASIVWLHDKDEHFTDSVQFVKSLKLKNVNWICPPIVYTNTSYDFGSNIKQDDREALDSAAKFVADLLLREPLNVVKGVGGFGMGAVVALQFATNCALGHYPINPRVVVGINGWLSITGSITSSIEYTVGAVARAASQKNFFTRGAENRLLPYTREEEVVESLREAGFGDVFFLIYSWLRHEHHLDIRDMLKLWLELSLPITKTSPLR
ncbi:unnamed protein product [Arabidopsis thaliana]|uniref:Alpha/beta-Hydrolases superfamily protein n=1 Tax=Arabidopsis thaliana TaxID=3702 RepID=A0A654EJ99_ARATH|nr:unnamed protein product [Arabidopsis thaliana]